MKTYFFLVTFIAHLFMVTHTYTQATCAGALVLTPGIQQCGDSAGQPGDFPGNDTAPLNPCSNPYNDDEYWFSYTVTGDGDTLNLILSGITQNWAGLFLLDDCPSNSPACVASDSNGNGTSDLIVSSGPLTMGATYYIVIANYGAPNNTNFCLDATVATGSVMPLDLIRFDGQAKESTNHLKWTTTNEVNVSHIEVQSSRDGRS